MGIKAMHTSYNRIGAARIRSGYEDNHLYFITNNMFVIIIITLVLIQKTNSNHSDNNTNQS